MRGADNARAKKTNALRVSKPKVVRYPGTGTALVIRSDGSHWYGIRTSLRANVW